jgi:predicted nucleotidyltransferase
MSVALNIEDIKTYVEQVAEEFDLKKVSLFGSYATGKRTRQSDIDLLVEFTEPTVSLLTVAGVKVKLEKLTGKSVDVVHSPIAEDSLLIIDKEILLYEY